MALQSRRPLHEEAPDASSPTAGCRPRSTQDAHRLQRVEVGACASTFVPVRRAPCRAQPQAGGVRGLGRAVERLVVVRVRAARSGSTRVRSGRSDDAGGAVERADRSVRARPPCVGIRAPAQKSSRPPRPRAGIGGVQQRSRARAARALEVARPALARDAAAPTDRSQLGRADSSGGRGRSGRSSPRARPRLRRPRRRSRARASSARPARGDRAAPGRAGACGRPGAERLDSPRRAARSGPLACLRSWLRSTSTHGRVSASRADASDRDWLLPTEASAALPRTGGALRLRARRIYAARRRAGQSDRVALEGAGPRRTRARARSPCGPAPRAPARARGRRRRPREAAAQDVERRLELVAGVLRRRAPRRSARGSTPDARAAGARSARRPRRRACAGPRRSAARSAASSR